MSLRTLLRLQHHVDRLPRPRTLRDIVRRSMLQDAIQKGILRAGRQRRGIA